MNIVFLVLVESDGNEPCSMYILKRNPLLISEEVFREGLSKACIQNKPTSLLVSAHRARNAVQEKVKEILRPGVKTKDGDIEFVYLLLKSYPFGREKEYKLFLKPGCAQKEQLLQKYDALIDEYHWDINDKDAALTAAKEIDAELEKFINA